VADVLVDGTSIGATGTYTFTNVVANHTIQALFQVQTFTITALPGPNGSILPGGAVAVPYGTDQLFTIAPNPGYQVASLTVDSVPVAPAVTYTFSHVLANHTIAATFVPIPTYQLTIAYGSGITGSPQLTATHVQGTVISYSYALVTGYKNLLVTLDGSPVAATGTVTMDRDHTLSASALIQTFTISASSGPNGSISPTGSTTLNYNGSQTYTITPNSGFVVSNVLVDGTSVGAVTSYTFSNLTANHTISATFATPPDFVLTVNLGAGATGVPSNTLGYTLGTLVHYSYSTAPGYTNLQVFLDGVPVPSFGDVPMDSAHTLTVTAQILTYTITASAGPNGGISPPGITTVNWGSSPVYTITPDPGYQVATLLVDGASVGASTTYTFAPMFFNQTIAATFSLLPPGPGPADRSGHSATSLTPGRTLVAGGSTGTTAALASTLIHDASTGTWHAAGGLLQARTLHTATRLPDGTVLVVGGRHASTNLAEAERYDPATDRWTPTGSLSHARAGHTATLLPDGTVLVAGGRGAAGGVLVAERYDPTRGTWQPVAGQLAATRADHTATLLPDGRVLLVGGLGSAGALATAELFDPGTGTWVSTSGPLTEARKAHTATLLADGTVLVVGGEGEAGALASAERFDPATGTWSITGSLAAARAGHQATLLASGRVLVSGGGAATTTALPTAEVFNPATSAWTPGGALTSPRSGHSATLQSDGSVLLAFGTRTEVPSEVYQP